MQRQTALIASLVSFVVFFAISYQGAGINTWSSIIFSLFVSLILLNILYPPGRAATDTADFVLFIYATVEVVGIILLGIYIAQKALCDVR